MKFFDEESDFVYVGERVHAHMSVQHATGTKLDGLCAVYGVFRCMDAATGQLETDAELRQYAMNIILGERHAPLQNTAWQEQQYRRVCGDGNRETRKWHGFDKDGDGVICVEYRETIGDPERVV